MRSTTVLALGMCAIALLAWWFCLPHVARTCAAVALLFGVCSAGVAFFEGAFEEIEDVNEPGRGRR